MIVRLPRLKFRIGGTEEEEEKQVWCVLEASKDKVLVTKFLSALERRSCCNFVSIFRRSW